MAHVWSDLRFASRTLRAKPAFTAVAVVSLALGIGANTAIFSVVDSALLRSLPFHNPDRLVLIGDHQPCCDSVSLSPGEYLDYKRQNKTFEDIAAIAWQALTLTGGAEARTVNSRAVTTNFFEVLGAHAEIGRLMSPKMDRPGSTPRVAVISDALWRSRFASDANIVGKEISLGLKPFKIVGVLAPHQEYPTDVEVWISPRLQVPEYLETTDQNPKIAETYGNHWLIGLGRLKPGIRLPTARAEMRTIADRIDAAHDEPGHWAVLGPLQGNMVQLIRPALGILGTAVVILLLIACANLAGLMMARATGRHRELAVRVAVGASNWELTRLLLSESFVLALSGGCLGVAFAFAALRLLEHYSPYQLPPALAPRIDVTVLLFCTAISFLTALLTGLVPAVTAGRVDINEALKETAKASASVATRRMRGLLVAAEIALSVTLLVGAFLLLRSFSNLLAVDPGFQSAGVTTGEILLARSRYVKPEQVNEFWTGLLAKVRALPGVESAGISSDLPIAGVGSGGDFEVEGHPIPRDKLPYSYHLYVSP
ncbi:MAG: ABC transporter permease, partial [Acidobacteriaceae bacterium]|nr:ABC transporter permease [Acidobacteriaceae bacterium]